MSAYRYWLPSDDDDLRRLWGDGVVPKEIAHRLGRTVDGVVSRRARLGLPTRKQSGVLTEVLAVQIEAEELGRLRKEARANGMQLSTHVRQLLKAAATLRTDAGAV